jgi:hypothetical protein
MFGILPWDSGVHALVDADTFLHEAVRDGARGGTVSIARLLGAMLLSLLLCSSALAAEGQVLRLEGPQLFVDIGARDGVRVGDEVQLLRVVELFDPDQGRTLRDRFTIGTGRVVEVGEVLTLVVADPAVVERLELGDVVLATSHPIEAPRPAPVPVATAPTAPVAAPAQSDTGPGQSAFLEAFAQAARAADLAQRRASWQRFIEAWPDAPMVPVVEEEIRAIEALEATALPAAPQRAPGRQFVADPSPVASAAPPPAPDQAAPKHLVVIPSAVTRIHAGRPIQVGVTVPEIHRVERAELFYRRQGAATWQQATMQPLGDTVLGATIPASVIEEPAVEWYVVVREHSGTDLRVPAGDAHRSTKVFREVAEPEIRDRSQVALTYEFVDFYQLKRADWFSIFEADFLYRVGAGPLHSMRIGYGVYDGVSGPVADIDAATDAQLPSLTSDVGYKYGVLELELTASQWLALLPRGIVGVQIDGMAMGLGGTVRIGQEEGTSLLVGGLHLGDVGQLYQLQLAWNTVPRVPMAAEVSVTNQPGVSLDDYGVRLVYEARYELTDWVQVGGRVGYQLRNIFHNGPGFGATVVFGW